MTMLPSEVVAEDRRLEATADIATEALMELRWRWTLDESNPKRVSMREYARQVGIDQSTVTRYANAGGLMISDHHLTPQKALTRASASEDRAAIIEAVAEVEGIAPTTVRAHHGQKVGRLLEHARERAEKKGTTVAEEAPAVAEWAKKARDADARVQIERRAAVSMRYIDLEASLLKAKRALTEALNVSHGVEWGDEERELLGDTIAGVKALLNLIDLAIAGTADIDWDAELASLEGGIK